MDVAKVSFNLAVEFTPNFIMKIKGRIGKQNVVVLINSRGIYSLANLAITKCSGKGGFPSFGLRKHIRDFQNEVVRVTRRGESELTTISNRVFGRWLGGGTTR